MNLLKIALASVNSTVGSVRSNTERCLCMAREMAASDVTVGVFPEQAVGGYPAEDLVQWRRFVDAQWEELQGISTPTGCARPAARARHPPGDRIALPRSDSPLAGDAARSLGRPRRAR
jgi:hypothetical protein